MKLFVLLAAFVFSTNMLDKLPAGWQRVDTAKIGDQKYEVYFFDYMIRIAALRPDISSLNGREFTTALEDIRFKFPTYVAKQKETKNDSLCYYILRPNEQKRNSMYHLDLEVVKVPKDFAIERLEYTENYKDFVVKSVLAIGCRGSVVSEHNLLIQQHPQKEQLIGNGFQIADSIFTRVIPFEEIKKAFYKNIEQNK